MSAAFSVMSWNKLVPLAKLAPDTLQLKVLYIV